MAADQFRKVLDHCGGGEDFVTGSLFCSAILEGIASVLHRQPDMELVGEASDGYEAIEAFAKFRPDVALIDLQMPGMNGIYTISAILEKWPDARCVVLTTYAGDVQATRALKAGAKGYLLKSMLRKELVDTIRTVHSGKSRIPAEIATELASHLTSDALSAREIEVLRMVREGCSNKTVADRLVISEDTVKGHMRSILSKLNANDRTHAFSLRTLSARKPSPQATPNSRRLLSRSSSSLSS